MPKIIPSIPGLKGHFGEFTFYTRCGERLVRKRHNGPVRRSLTHAQLSNRMKLNNGCGLWRSFEGEAKPKMEGESLQEAYGRFRSRAMQSGAVYLRREDWACGASIVVEVTLGKGTLKAITATLVGKRVVSDVWLGGLEPAGCSVGEFARAVIDHNEDFRQGDGLWAVCCRQKWNATLGIPYSQGSTVRLRLDVCDPSPLSECVGGSMCFANKDGYLATGEEIIGGVAWLHVRGSGEAAQSSSGRLCVNNPLIGQYQDEEAQTRSAESYGGFTDDPGARS